MDFDNNKYKVYTWKHWMMLHWILNPGLAFNELVLGQRVPKITLEDISSDKPRFDRVFIPCPHCGKIHDSRTWSTESGTAFKNWFGLYCPNCGQIIPCVMNVTTWAILAITFPIWGWFKNSLKEIWLKKQPKRYANLVLEGIPNPYEKDGWIKEGLGFGLIMFVLMEVVCPLADPEGINWKKFLFGIPLWALSGIGWGYFMKVFFGKKRKPASN